MKKSPKKSKSQSKADELATAVQQLLVELNGLTKSFRNIVQPIAIDAEAIAQSAVALSNAVSTLAPLVPDHSKSTPPAAEGVADLAGLANRIALNAAIEASGIGELGAGFAHIADDIRRLAERLTKLAATNATASSETVHHPFKPPSDKWIEPLANICQRATQTATSARAVDERLGATELSELGNQETVSLAELCDQVRRLTQGISKPV